MKRSSYWYPVDNAGKVFPAVSKDSRSSVFRLSFYLNDLVIPEILEQAVNEILPRFEPFAVELKSGLFWYYFSINTKKAIVREEPSVICKFVPWEANNGYLFSVYYYHNKITLETFHALSDGTGAMEFLKSITYRYLTLKGYPLEHEGMILGQSPISPSEGLDMFNHKYDKTKKKNLKEQSAYHLTGERFHDHYSVAVRIKVPTKQLLELTRKLHVTIGEYSAALVAYSIYIQQPACRLSKKPIKIFIPVNLRKFFSSKTIRNFSLYIKATFSCTETWTFEQMLQEAKNQFEQQLQKEDLQGRVNSNVGIEKNLLIRLLPLAVKDLGFKIGYHYLAENINTTSISNLGNVTLPHSMQCYISDIEFNIGGTNLSIVSYGDYTNFTMNTEIKDFSIIQHFMNTLVRSGIDVSVDTNYRENLDEIM